MASRNKDTEFAFDQISLIAPRSVPVTRALQRLLIHLHTGGFQLSSSNKKISVEEFSEIVEREFVDTGVCKDDAKIIKNWLMEEYVSIDYGKSKKSDNIGLKKIATVGEIFPLHISSVKLQDAKKSDFGQGLFLYTVLLEHEQLRKVFKTFFSMSIKDDINGNIDLDTLMMVKSLSNVRNLKPQLNKKLNVVKPYCIGHAKVFADDLWRILAYRNTMPKKEVVNAILTLIGLHVGIYYLKLFRAIPGMVRTGKACNKSCCVDPQSKNPFENCPYQQKFFVDCSEDYRSMSAELGRSSVKKINQEIEPYVKAHLIVKKLTNVVNSGAGAFDYFSELEKPDADDLEGYLKLRQHKDIEELSRLNIMTSIMNDEDLNIQHEKMKSSRSSSFDNYINLIFDKVYRPKEKEIIGMMDQLFGKNKDTGILRIGKGRKNARRYCMSAGLIEILIQLAVLGVDNNKNFYTRNITFIELLEWLENRYGILIDKTVDMERTTESESAFRENLINLKAKLRELGFFTDLSDASNVQLVRPRFRISEIREVVT